MFLVYYLTLSGRLWLRIVCCIVKMLRDRMRKKRERGKIYIKTMKEQ